MKWAKWAKYSHKVVKNVAVSVWQQQITITTAIALSEKPSS